jgi:SAM-dependent methyltransferase
MIGDALRQNIPAVRQPAESLIIHDKSVDVVVFAYGTHHISYLDKAIGEARRVLRKSGTIIIHDYDIGTPTAKWYTDVLHNFTRTGHAYTHFTPNSMRELIAAAGFRVTTIAHMYDPIVVHDDSAQKAWSSLLRYLVDLFGLEKLREAATNEDELEDKLEIPLASYATFAPGTLPENAPREPTVFPDGDDYRAELPRVALVGVGVAD